MNRALLLSPGYFSSCSSESDNESSSDSDEPTAASTDAADGAALAAAQCRKKPRNFIAKLLNRERTGYFNNNILHKNKQHAFDRVPKRLSFCLKEIVPYCYLTGHIFMGLTVCGQFLLSYKVVCDEDAAENNYNFSQTYRYELFFWIYRPHNLLCKYYNVCLFDDHGVDSFKVVSMSQWQSNPRVLVVHGDGKFENEDSYITVVAVPKLGCLDCRKLRDDFYADTFDPIRCAVMCLQCNLTIHTKYCRTETDPKFNPKLNLICNDKIVIVTNGLIHMIQFGLDLNRPVKRHTHSIDVKYIRQADSESIEAATSTDETAIAEEFVNSSAVPQIQCPESSISTQEKPIGLGKPAMAADKSNCSIIETKPPPRSENIVARIIADFAECESDYPSNDKLFPRPNTSSNFNELVITCGGGPNAMPSCSKSSNKVRLLSHRSNRIISKSINSLKNGITKVDLHINSTQLNAANNKNLDKAAKAYEFSEDNEKCEKISIFRKRRLADKKYEFSEDNSENITPFVRSSIRNFPSYSKMPKSSPGHSSFLSSSSPTNFDIHSHSPHHTHRASPSCGFRSPCGSPVSNRFMMMSPPGRSYFYAKSPTYVKQSSMSPRTQATKRSYMDSSFEHCANMLPSPRSDDYEVIKNAPSALSGIQPLSEMKPSNIDVKNQTQQSGSSLRNDLDIEKPVCSIRLVRRFVEEDGATSVITSEEDDCISPGYHTSLPLEVHGSSYSEMQMVSKATYEKLLCPTIIVTQNTFDLEAFTYYVANYLCSMNNKKYGFFVDCACEIIKICPLSCNITCILMVHFTARDIQPPTALKPCVNCSNTQNLDCVFHRKHYECRILFTWDIDTGEWNVQDYGDLHEVPTIHGYDRNSSELHRTVKKLAAELIGSLGEQPELFQNVRVLDSCNEKSKDVLKDLENSIEFYRSSDLRHPFDNNYTYSSDISDIE